MIKMLQDKEFLKRFFKIAFPVMLHAFILFIVNFVDNIMVGSVSNEAVSGVYAANQATYILMIAAYGIIIGAGIFIQQFNGAKDEKRLKEAFRYKIVVMSIFVVVITILYFFFGKYLVWFYCHKDQNADLIYQEGMKYLYIMILSYIPYCASMLYTTTVREIGETKYALIAGVIAFGMNVILNSIFIFGFKMGVRGAALGTVIARTVELFAIVVLCKKKHFSFCEGVFKDFQIEKELRRKIFKKGIVFLANELFWVVGITLLSLAYAQRDGVLSSLSVVNSMSNIFNIIFQGLSIGIGVIVGSYLGQSEFEEAKKYTRYVYWLGFLISVSFGVIILCLAPWIPYMFSKIDPSQKALATKLLRIYGCFLWANCMYTCCYMTLKTGGRAIVTFCLDSGLMWCVAVPLAWALVRFTNLSLLWIFFIITCFDMLKFVIGITCVKKGRWLQNLTLLETEKKG